MIEVEHIDLHDLELGRVDLVTTENRIPALTELPGLYYARNRVIAGQYAFAQDLTIVPDG